MKDLFKLPVTIEKIEFWGATLFYTISVFTLLGHMAEIFDPAQYSSYYIPTLCKYTIFYLSFLLCNFIVVRLLIKGRYIVLNLLLLVIIFAATVIALGTTETWLSGFEFNYQPVNDVYQQLFLQQLLLCVRVLLLFTFYTLIKIFLRSAFITIRPYFMSGHKQLILECAVAFGFWILIAFFFKMSGVNWKAGVVWCEVLLYGIFMYAYLSYKLIPEAIANKQDLRDLILRVLVIVLISTVPVSGVCYLIFHRLNAVFYMNVFNAGLGLIIVTPFTWHLYRYRLSHGLEIKGLKTALGRSSANLDLLRSQINPHFLFNALNTLYGTSLQENAERTGEGIQRLGDMMRFMLLENMQDTIALSREIDYLKNYIALQTLRTQTSPDILIQVEIEEQPSGLEIAPMLLIPFVENAFKHGISLREASHIKISLQTRENNELLFDVYNSVHPKPANDPERNNSGIGMENVKQRLQLLYPGKHDLVVRQGPKEFFIHLTIQLA